MEKVSKENAEKMANWWAEQLKNPIQNMGSKEQGGNEIANLLGTLLAAEHKPSNEQIEKFKEKLVEIIEENNINSLYSDYYPDDAICNAAEYAGIDGSVFPWKSETIIRGNEVLAKRGFGERLEKI